MQIKVSNFLGSFPRIHKTKLKDTAAEKALNVDVTSGVLRPFYALPIKQKLNEIGSETKSIAFYKFPEKEGFFQFKDYVDICYSPIADDQYRRVYWSGDSRDNGHKADLQGRQDGHDQILVVANHVPEEEQDKGPEAPARDRI